MATVKVVIDPERYLEELRARMTRHGISQNQLAKQLGMYSSQLSRILNNPNPPRVATIARIEEAMAALVKASRRKPTAAGERRPRTKRSE